MRFSVVTIACNPRSLTPNATLRPKLTLVNAFGCSNTAASSMPFSPRVALLSLNACLVQLLLFRNLTTLHIIIMRYVLHWLPVHKRIGLRVSAWVWRCQLGGASSHQQMFCYATSGLVTRINLPSASSGGPFARTSKKQRPAYSTKWNI